MAETSASSGTPYARRQWAAEKAAWVKGLPPVLAKQMPDRLDGDSQDAAPVGNRMVSAEEWRAVLENQLAIFDSQNRLHLAHEQRGVGQVVGAWRAVFYRQLRATLTLMDSGLRNESQANARAALEHAALLASLHMHRQAGTLTAFMEDVVTAVHRSAGGHLKVLRRADRRTGGSNTALLAAATQVNGGMPPKGDNWDGLPAMLFDALPHGERFYSLYRELSNNVHAGGGSAMPFALGILEQGVLQREPRVHRMADMLSDLVVCAVLSDRAMDGFLVEPRLEALHASALAQVNLYL